jgi:serine/threonine protein kinase
MVEALNLVYASRNARHVAEYPLSVRTPDETSNHCYELVYRKLVDFRIGAPDRTTDSALYDVFAAALSAAVAAVNDAGVIHGDLYLSNVMWRPDDHGGVDIKIIDWDAAHCVDEGGFTPKVKAALDDYLTPEKVSFGREHDELYVSVLAVALLEEDALHWLNLASNDKEKVDTAFRWLLHNRVLFPSSLS